MGDMKHTPGEWRIDDDGDGLRIVGSPTWPCTRFGVKGEWDVAIIERLDDFPDEEAANARLIAAAPDAVDLAEMVADESDQPHLRAAAQRWLAKARGQ